jgi:hypothetical protein
MDIQDHENTGRDDAALSALINDVFTELLRLSPNTVDKLTRLIKTQNEYMTAKQSLRAMNVIDYHRLGKILDDMQEKISHDEKEQGTDDSDSDEMNFSMHNAAEKKINPDKQMVAANNSNPHQFENLQSRFKYLMLPNTPVTEEFTKLNINADTFSLLGGTSTTIKESKKVEPKQDVRPRSFSLLSEISTADIRSTTPTRDAVMQQSKQPQAQVIKQRDDEIKGLESSDDPAQRNLAALLKKQVQLAKQINDVRQQIDQKRQQGQQQNTNNQAGQQNTQNNQQGQNQPPAQNAQPTNQVTSTPNQSPQRGGGVG